MKVVLPDIPQTVSRRTIVQFIESLGMNPREVKELEFTTRGVYVTVTARREDGENLQTGPNELARHRLYIEIVD